jgi:hypothetical protein
MSPYESVTSLYGEGFVPLIRKPGSAYFGNSQEKFDETNGTASSFPASKPTSPGSSWRTSLLWRQNRDSSGPDRVTYSPYMTDSIGQEASNLRQSSEALPTPEPVRSSKSRKLKKKLHTKTMESQVLKFRTWEKPHRTDEHITPGVYRGFWISFARCLTFYIPSWFLKKYLKMDDLRQRLAFRQKVLFCILLAAITQLRCESAHRHDCQ